MKRRLKNRHLKLSFDAVHWDANTLFYHVHDGDFEIRPTEPKLIIGVHFLEKKTRKQEKNNLFRQLVKLLTTLS